MGYTLLPTQTRIPIPRPPLPVDRFPSFIVITSPSVIVTTLNGNRSRAAVLLGLTRNKFYRLLKLHGLDGESSRNGPGESDWIQ